MASRPVVAWWSWGLFFAGEIVTNAPKLMDKTLDQDHRALGEYVVWRCESLSCGETVIASGRPDAPTYFMPSHSLELGLNAYLVAKAGIEYEAMLDLGHNIKKAYDWAVNAGLDANIEHASSLVQLLSDFSSRLHF
jgi:hypothetical protein